MAKLRGLFLFAALLLAAPGAWAAASSPGAAAASLTVDSRPWPRQYTVGNTQFTLYRPQLDSWTDNRLQARSVMAVKTGTAADAGSKPADTLTYGVLWMSARTETDRDARQVTLTDIAFSKVSFPTHADQEQTYLALARAVAPVTQLVVSLDQMEAGLATAKLTPQSVAVNNTPPDIIFSYAPSVLVLVDGDPVWKPSGVAGVERVINSRALLLRYQGGYYLGYGGHWARAADLNGPWSAASSVATAVTQASQKAVAENQAPAAKDVPADIADSFAKGQFPAVFLRTHPSELIEVTGQPEFDAITGTGLKYIANTPANVFVLNDRWYVLASGRWFSGASANGPWTYVAQGSLPRDFSAIPPDSPKSAVLASIAGTPAAREAVIANSIPQTATIDKTKASFQSQYDGAPRFVGIGGTKLSYAANSATAIINVPGASYYALYNGVWFRAEGANGPWAVTAAVPAAIYAIPSSSPVHYVTYAKVYGADGNNIYVGYTPGYYGTVVADNVVVYGTGYACNSWVGTAWYGCPATYGYGAAFAWGAATGWTLAFGWGWYDPWYDPWWGPWAGHYAGFYYPWAYGGAVAANVYGHWGNSVVAGTAAAWANPWTGNAGRAGRGAYYNPVTGGRGVGYAGRNTNVYTGRTTAAAGGVRYNPQTGRVVAGRGAEVGNIYTGNGAVAGAHTAVNTNTGRVTNAAGGASRTGAGATAAGAFNSAGPGGNASGAGYVHYDRATGNVNRGGAVDVNGNVYAGRDGNVYRYQQGQGWEKAGSGDQFQRVNQHDAALDNDRLARGNGEAREQAASRVQNSGFANRASGSFGGGIRAGGSFHGRR